MIHNLGSGAAATGSQQTFTAGAAPQAATEGQFFGRVQLTTAGTVRTDTFLQFVEDVRTLAAQTVTLSFWAKADASRTVDVYSGEAMGTGGSGASAEQTKAFTIGTSWQRYTWTFTTPSLSGKTIGTGSSRYIYFKLPLATCTLDVWGVQLEGNYQPTPFEQRPIGVELQLCQRYYYRKTFPSVAPSTLAIATMSAYSAGSLWGGIIVKFPVVMRTNNPTVAVSARSDFNAWSQAASVSYAWASNTLEANSEYVSCWSGIGFGAPGFTVGTALNFAAANNNAWIEASAEL
jgi:hypothetical protein